MIADLQADLIAPGQDYEGIDPHIEARDRRLAREFLLRLVAPFPTERPSEWVERNIIFDEPQIRGPFSFAGREYLRQPIDDNAEDDIHDQTLIFGTGSGKTICYMAGQAWAMIHETRLFIPVMAGIGKNFRVMNYNIN